MPHQRFFIWNVRRCPSTLNLLSASPLASLVLAAGSELSSQHAGCHVTARAINAPQAIALFRLARAPVSRTRVLLGHFRLPARFRGLGLYAPDQCVRCCRVLRTI